MGLMDSGPPFQNHHLLDKVLASNPRVPQESCLSWNLFFSGLTLRILIDNWIGSIGEEEIEEHVRHSLAQGQQSLRILALNGLHCFATIMMANR